MTGEFDMKRLLYYSVRPGVKRSAYAERKVRRTVFFLPLLLLVACRQEAVPPATPVPPAAEARPAAAPLADDRPVIVAFGDSLSAGFGVEAGLSYPDYLQKELDARGLKYRVANLGISGDTTSGGLSRVASAVELKPRLVILELGGNDGLRGTPLVQTRANLEAMVKAFQSAGARVVIAGMTLPPNYGADYVKQFESIFVDLAAQYKLTRVRFLLEGVWDQPGLMQPDGIHPTAPGNAEVARRVAKVIAPLL